MGLGYELKNLSYSTLPSSKDIIFTTTLEKEEVKVLITLNHLS